MSTRFTTTRCLPDVPGGAEPVIWRTSLLSPSKWPKNGWLLDIPSIPPAARADLERRIEGGFMATHNDLDSHPLFAAGQECRSTPDDAAFAYHPSNALAILSAIYELCGFGSQGERWLLSGSIASDGTVLPVSNPIQLALEAKRRGARLIIERSSAEIAKAVHDDVWGIDCGTDLYKLVHCVDDTPYQVQPKRLEQVALQTTVDMADVIGQEQAKQALIMSVAGGHPLLFVGPPGAGKSLLASCIPGISPPLSEQERIEVASIWQSSGKLAADQLPMGRPLRSIDNNTTKPALLGGGSDQVYAGEVSLAHAGYLYVDELMQMTRSTLEALRTPMQDGVAVISRTGFKVEFPARFQLVAATNPCVCTYWSPDDESKCTCTKSVREAYQAKMSGAVFDRIHIVTHLKQPDAVEAFLSPQPAMTSSEVRGIVMAAVDLQMERQGKLNAKLGAADMNALRARLKPEAVRLLSGQDISIRGLTNILKLAQTVADLSGTEMVDEQCVETAMRFSKKHL